MVPYDDIDNRETKHPIWIQLQGHLTIGRTEDANDLKRDVQVIKEGILPHTVDCWNPAPPGMYETL